MENVMYIASLHPPGGKRLVGNFDFGKNCDVVFKVDLELGASMLRNYRLDVKQIVPPEGFDVLTIRKEEPVVQEEKPVDLTVIDEDALTNELLSRYMNPGHFMRALVEKLRALTYNEAKGKSMMYALTAPFWNSELEAELSTRALVVVPHQLFEQMHISHQAVGFQRKIDELRAEFLAKDKEAHQPKPVAVEKIGKNYEVAEPVAEPKVDGRKRRWMNKGK